MEIDFFTGVKIAGKSIDAGRYTLYAIPEKDKWTIILNKETDIWGDFGYDEKKDVLRTDVQVQTQPDITEALSMVFQKSATGSDLIMVWDNVKVSLPVVY